MAFVKHSLLWLLGTIVITPIAWSTSVSLLQAVLVPTPDDTLALFLASALLGSMWGAVVVVAFAVPYGLLLLVWPWLFRLLPWVERTRVGLTLTVGAIALPAALFVGFESAQFAGTIRPREFAMSFLCAQVAGWIGLLAPRLFLSSLKPGTFLAIHARAAG